VLERFAQVGFRAPLPDGTRGGDARLDVYLVDFGGNADGAWSSEGCDSSNRCSGYFAMENDFVGYGYANVSAAIATLTSHELFHGVQAAYDSTEPNWFSVGTAVWAEQLFDPESRDFLSFCDAYLDDTARSLDEPPAAPVPTFAYATALWWWFLTDQHGDAFLLDLLEATDGSDGVLADMQARIEADGATLEERWSTFASWNLATGRRAGALDGYPFAARIGPVRASAEGATIDDENRYYPLATTYYRIEHPGGPMGFALAVSAPELVFALHPEDAQGRVLPAVETFDGGSPVDFGDLAAGAWWVVGTKPNLEENSTRVRTCIGPQAWTCAEGAVDTGADGTDTGESPEEGGCGCASGGVPASAASLGLPALALALLARRRRAR
jgi:MYXO-CTERM domain-containing protein